MKEENMKSPFKFLDSYTAADRDIFFGRDQEIEEIYSKVFQSKLLLVYGASGTGKSSIINCGLANKFDESDWLPIHIRRGGNIRRSMFNQIQKQAIHQVNISDQEAMLDSGLEKALSSVFLDHFKPIYLIFDQFEELFIFGYKDEWQDFISAIKFLMGRDLEIHFIFVVRGEYLEFLSEFEDLIPEFFDNRVRIEKMTRKKAAESIAGPARVFPIEIENGFEEKLLKKLSPENSQIELTFLQVFLDKIYKTAADQSGSKTKLHFSKSSVEKLGHIGDVLAEFVDEQLFKMNDSKAALAVLKSFVSLQGTKTQKTLSEVHQYTNDIGYVIEKEEIESILAEFVNKRILKDQDENGKYELRHDSLAQKIFEKITIQERELLDIRQFLSHSHNEFEKRGTLLNDEDLSYITPHLKSLKLEAHVEEFVKISRKNSSKRQKQRRTRNVVIFIIVGLMITSFIGFFYSQDQKSKAEELALIARQESEEAKKQREFAEDQSLEAQRNAELANEQKAIAEESTNEAERQKALALTQKQIAEREKEIADIERQNSEQNALEARRQETIANEQRQLALRLRMLSLSREMAVKSRHLIDPQLKALLAYQAYQFNRDHNGDPFQPEIYEALYYSKKALSDGSFNADKTHNQAIKSMVSRTGGLYSAGNDGKLTKTLWVDDKPQTTLLLNSQFAIECLDISTDESHAVFGTLLGEVIYYDLIGKTTIFSQKIYDKKVSAVFLDGSQIVTVGMDGKVHLLNLQGEIVHSLTTNEEVLDASLKNSRLWLATKNGEVIEVNSDQQVDSRFTPYQNKNLTSLAVNKSGKLAAIGYRQGEIVIWDLQQSKAIQILPGHTAAITDLHFDEKDKFLISGSYDRSIRLWQLDKLQEPPLTIQDHDSWVSAISFDPSGNYFYSGVFGGIQRRFTTHAEDMTQDLCRQLSRNLTQQEWAEYVADDLSYEQTCTDD